MVTATGTPGPAVLVRGMGTGVAAQHARTQRHNSASTGVDGNPSTFIRCSPNITHSNERALALRAAWEADHVSGGDGDEAAEEEDEVSLSTHTTPAPSTLASRTTLGGGETSTSFSVLQCHTTKRPSSADASTKSVERWTPRDRNVPLLLRRVFSRGEDIAIAEGERVRGGEEEGVDDEAG